jgi:hypothetical protein
MSKTFVRLLSKIDCEWEGLSPTYRLYINDELFSERTWVWEGQYLVEELQVEAEPDTYKLRYELVPPCLAELKIGDLTVDYGPAEIIDNTTFRITNETV